MIVVLLSTWEVWHWWRLVRRNVFHLYNLSTFSQILHKSELLCERSPRLHHQCTINFFLWNHHCSLTAMSLSSFKLQYDAVQKMITNHNNWQQGWTRHHDSLAIWKSLTFLLNNLRLGFLCGRFHTLHLLKWNGLQCWLHVLWQCTI